MSVSRGDLLINDLNFLDEYMIKKPKRIIKPKKPIEFKTPIEFKNPKKPKKPIESKKLPKKPIDFTLDKSLIFTNYIIPQECIKQYENLTIKNELGRGEYGTVYNTCIDNECKYALKIARINLDINDNDPLELEDFNKECKYAKLAGDLNIGPKLIKSWICNNVKPKFYKYKIKMGFILMEKMDMTLTKYIKINIDDNDKIKNVRKMYLDLCKIMLKNNIYNEDLHFGNVMLNINDNNIEMKFIDWSHTKEIKSSDRSKYFKELETKVVLETNRILKEYYEV